MATRWRSSWPRRRRGLPLGDVLGEIERDLDVLVSRDATAPERHRSLGAALDVSGSLLAEAGQRALAWLSPFTGAFRHPATSPKDSCGLHRLHSRT
jgi:predicted ATPase